MTISKIPSRKINVLIIDDSALIRSILTEVINSFPDMQAVGAASDPVQAKEMIKTLNPDVLTLDVEMQHMDGLTFLEKLMRLHPMPVLLISSMTEKGSEAALRSLELGAVGFLAKPKFGIAEGMRDYADTIAEKIRVAFQARSKFRISRTPAFREVLPALGSRIGIDGRHGGNQRIPHSLARRCTGDRDCAAHAGSIHQVVRIPA
jgi:two-component system chemotaxis response regulator CheB